jgi:hypothetical protein
VLVTNTNFYLHSPSLHLFEQHSKSAPQDDPLELHDVHAASPSQTVSSQSVNPSESLSTPSSQAQTSVEAELLTTTGIVNDLLIPPQEEVTDVAVTNPPLLVPNVIVMLVEV